MSFLKKIFVYGASGHAKVVIDIIERQGLYEIVFLVDDDSVLKGKVFFGYQVIGDKRQLLQNRDRVSGGIVAIGSNRARCAVADWLTDNGIELVSAIHPSAQIGRGVTIESGTVVMAGAVINADTVIGRNVIINTGAHVDHDCAIGDGAHIAPGSTLCGTVRIGAASFICAGATIIPNLSVGSYSIVGAGATVIRSIPDEVLVAGSPARLIKTVKECYK